MLPAIPLFFALGTAVYVFYLHNPAALAPSKPSEVLPRFIVQQLPAGVAAGLALRSLRAES